MRSILDTGFSTRAPQQNATIPFGYYANGAPFLIYSQAEITSFKIVCLRTRLETELSTSIILSEGAKRYYKSTHELGVPRGSYFYKIGIGEVEQDVYKLEGTDAAGNYLGFDSNQAYGVFDFDIDYIAGGGIDADIIRDGIDYYYIRLASTVIQFKYKSTTLFEIPNTFITTTGRVKLTVKRNETLNQYFTGAVNAFAFFIDEVLIDDTSATVGSNPLVDSSLTTSTERKYYCSQGISLYNYPEIYTVTFGAFSLVQIGTVVSGGSPIYSQVFKIDEHMRGPTPEVGDFNSDFNNDFLNFEASGVIDENGDEC